MDVLGQQNAGGAFGDVSAVFNPDRYYAELSSDQYVAGGTGASTDFRSAVRDLYLPMVLIVGAIWVLERRRLGIGFSFGAKAKAGAKT